MKCLHRLFRIIDANCFPSCCKEFLIKVYKKGGKLKYDPVLLRTGSDSRPLLELGFIVQDTDTRVDVTDYARELID